MVVQCTHVAVAVSMSRQPIQTGFSCSMTSVLNSPMVDSISALSSAYPTTLWPNPRIGLFKNEAARDGSPFRHGSLRSIDDVEWVTTGWVDWCNVKRLHSTLGDVPPDEFEDAYYADLETPTHPVLAPA